jgi:hypothetical protein
MRNVLRNTAAAAAFLILTGAAMAQNKETGFSKDFVTAVIEEMALIREWRVALDNAVQHNYPVSEDWIGNYRPKPAGIGFRRRNHRVGPQWSSAGPKRIQQHAATG